MEQCLQNGAAMKRGFVCGLLVACGGGNTPDPSGIFTDPCPATACTAGPTVSSGDQLATEVDRAAAWSPLGEYTSGCMPASTDLTVTGTVTLGGDQLAIPSTCGADCRQKIVFRIDPAATGVTCNEPEQFFDFTACGSITLADTTVRVRAELLDVHPSAFGNFMPLVDVLGACTAPCGGDRLACEANHTCWSSVRDHCAYCLNGTNEECACWTGDAFEPDGAACEMFVSGDLIASGTCHAGACVVE